MKYTLNDFPSSGYMFDHITGEITLTGFSKNIDKTNIHSILNVSRGIVIMQANSNGSLISNIIENVITLQYDTTEMNDSDILMFVFDFELKPTDISESSIISMTNKIGDLLKVFNRFLSYFQTLTNKDSSGRLNVNVNTGNIAITGGTITTVGTITTLQNLTSMGGQDAKTFQNNLGFIAYAVGRRSKVNYT